MSATRRRNGSMVVFRMLRSMATGRPVRVIYRDGAGRKDGRVVRWWRDPRREPRSPKSKSSPLVFVFADGTEVAVNSIERVLGPNEGEES